MVNYDVMISNFFDSVSEFLTRRLKNTIDEYDLIRIKTTKEHIDCVRKIGAQKWYEKDRTFMSISRGGFYYHDMYDYSSNDAFNNMIVAVRKYYEAQNNIDKQTAQKDLLSRNKEWYWSISKMPFKDIVFPFLSKKLLARQK